MKATCPDCGFHGEMAAFLVEGESRDTVAEALRIPAELGAGTVLRYLSLFRPAGRALAHTKATRLLRALADDIERGTVRRRGRDWTAPILHWRQAMEAMLDARERLTLPLKNHHYLHEIVASLANTEEATHERQVETQRQHGQHRPTPSARTEPTAAREILSGLMKGIQGGSARD